MRQVLHPVKFPVAADDANAEYVKSLKVMKKEKLLLCKKEMNMALETFSTSAERHEKHSRCKINLKTSRARFSTLTPFVLLGILSEFVVPLIRKISVF
jgi:hypothetical protein